MTIVQDIPVTSKKSISRKRISWGRTNNIEAYIPGDGDYFLNLPKPTQFNDGTWPIDILITSDINKDGVSYPSDDQYRVFNKIIANDMEGKHLSIKDVQCDLGIDFKKVHFDSIHMQNVYCVNPSVSIFDSDVTYMINIQNVMAGVKLVRTPCDCINIMGHARDFTLLNYDQPLCNKLSLTSVDTSIARGVIYGSVVEAKFYDCNLTNCNLTGFVPDKLSCVRTMGDGTYIKSLVIGPFTIAYTSDMVWISSNDSSTGHLDAISFGISKIHSAEALTVMTEMDFDLGLSVFDYILDHPATPFGKGLGSHI